MNRKRGFTTKKRKRLPKHYALPFRKTIRWALVFTVLAMLIYSPAVTYDFVYDDNAVLTSNRYVQRGLEGIGDIWRNSYFKGFNENVNVRAYRPLPLTTLAVEYEFFGLNRYVHHGVNILLYGLTAFFLTLLMGSLWRQFHPLLFLLTVLFFVVHPLHVEVVANIKSRDELLAFLNYAIAFWLLVRYVDTQTKWRLAASVGCFALAMFSKESAITTVAVLPLALFFFRKIQPTKALTYALPYVAVMSVFLIIRSQIVGGLNAGVELTALDNSLLAAEGWNQKTASHLLVLGYYWFKQFVPHPLLSDYSYLTLPIVTWSDWRVWLSLITYLGILGYVVRGLFRKDVLAFTLAYYLITLSIFSSLIITNVNAYADRFQYNPSLGIAMLVAVLTVRWIDPQTQNWKKLMREHSIAFGLVVVVSIMAIVKTMTHLPRWSNRYSLFAYEMQQAPNNARTLKNYGGTLARQALAETDPNRQHELAEQAVNVLTRALSIWHDISSGHLHLGNMYMILRRYDEAEQAYLYGRQYNPYGHLPQTSLANVWYRQGRYQESVNLLEGLDKSRFSKNDYWLLSLGHQQLGNTAQSDQYRQLAGR